MLPWAYVATKARISTSTLTVASFAAATIGGTRGSLRDGSQLFGRFARTDTLDGLPVGGGPSGAYRMTTPNCSSGPQACGMYATADAQQRTRTTLSISASMDLMLRMPRQLFLAEDGGCQASAG